MIILFLLNPLQRINPLALWTDYLCLSTLIVFYGGSSRMASIVLTIWGQGERAHSSSKILHSLNWKEGSVRSTIVSASQSANCYDLNDLPTGSGPEEGT